jgi:sugar phosphate isomerase/epimerase
MRFGVCTTVENAPAVKSAGWDFVEESIQGLLQGTTPDEQWTGLTRLRGAALTVPAANMLVPASIKITGPTADLSVLQNYMTTVLTRAQKINMTTLVFGSGGARHVPDFFDRDVARKQIIDFVAMAAPIAQRCGVTLVAEPLNRGECNIINTVAEAMTYVKAVNHPNFQCLVDSYHFWLEEEPLENLEEAMPWIKHVHVADKLGRTAPGVSGASRYVSFFQTLQNGNYEGPISVEAPGFNGTGDNGTTVLEYLKREWAEAAAL